MIDNDKPLSQANELRQRAEAMIRKGAVQPSEDRLETLVPEDTRLLFHELTVHQHELEMQNEELRRTQGELDSARSRYFDLYNQAPVGYCTLSAAGNIVEANRTAATLLGAGQGMLINQPITRYILAEDQDIYYLHCQKRADAASLYECELRMVKEDGTLFWAHLAATFTRQGDRSAERRLVISDITERKRAEEELLKSQKLESLGLLAGGIAHDFNNILMVVMGNISFAKTLLSPTDKAYERLTIAETAALKAKYLTQQFLTFSKGGAPVKRTIAVANLIRSYGRLALSGTKSSCEYTIPEDLWPVDADEGQLGQALTNILINADQSMEKGGVVRIDCQNVVLNDEQALPLNKGRYVKISIQDQGGGIPADCLDKVFDPYFTTKKTGCGLGLTSAYSILKNHEGYLVVESPVGAGTIFTLFLPASSSEVSLPKGDEPEIQAGGGKILVMDDDEVVLQVVGAMLEDLGYEVELVSDGQAAISRYADAWQSARAFDAVIMDLTVSGGMGGKEALPKLRAIDPEAKVIVSSGYNNDPVMANYSSHGFCGVLVKPYRLAELSQQVCHVLGR